MSTIQQIGPSSVSSPVVKPNQDCKFEPMMGGTSFMHWDEYGYRFYAIEEESLVFFEDVKTGLVLVDIINGFCTVGFFIFIFIFHFACI